MKLHHRDFGGTGRPLVICHGMFASSKNWAGVGRALAAKAHVYALDLRNHGDSPHAPTHSLEDLRGDLEKWIEANCSEPPDLLGHSMGGLAAMAVAVHTPELVRRLVVADIAPLDYGISHHEVFAALELDISQFSSRGELDAALVDRVPDEAVRGFVHMNARRTKGGFAWTVNVDALRSATVGRDAAALNGTFDGPTLLVFGAESPYWTAEAAERARSMFGGARIEVIPGAGHWLHVTAQAEFVEVVGGFISADQ